MVKWKVVYTTQAKKDAKKLAHSELNHHAVKLLTILEKDPYQNSPLYEKLTGDLIGACSRRINIQHRLVYQIFDDIKTVKVIRMWSHYE